MLLYDSVDVRPVLNIFCWIRIKILLMLPAVHLMHSLNWGQLWGNPLYRWDVMEKNYKWRIDRIRSASQIYDVVRIDHFRGFESYYTIPYGRPDATVGEWRKGPDIKLFKEVKNSLENKRSLLKIWAL